MFSGGPGSGVHLSRDGGSTWKKLENGLPRPAVGKVDVAISAVNPRRMFALIQTADQGSLWRSDDGGEKWEAVSWDRRLIGRAGYYIRLGLSSGDENELLVASSTLWRSTDGGRTFVEARGGCGDCHDVWIDSTNPDHYVATGDGGMGITTTHGRSFTSVQLPIGQMYHVAVDDRVPYWIYSNRQDDGTMRGPSDSPVPVPNVPEYRPRAGGRPGFGTGGAAGEPGGGAPGGEEPSSGAASGGASSGGARGGGPPSDLPPGGGGGGGFGPGAQPRPCQQGIGGCESGFTIPVPGDPEVVWASCYGNEVTRYDGRLGRARSVSPWMHTLDSEPDKLKYRCHWTPPLAIDPFEPETVYYGCQVIFRISDRGQSWQVISPDLSTRDPSRVVSSGGVIGDNLGQFYGEVVFAIAPSPVQRGLIWAGTNDGKVWYTRDGGKDWSDVTSGLKDLPPWGMVTKIEPSHFDAATAYVVVDHHFMDTRDPFIYRTTDFGKTWTRISDGLPHGQPLAYALSLAENPNRRGMLFAGTGSGFFYSADDGRTWTRFKEGLPASPVTWIEVQKRYHDVVVSTYGRGLYVLRDITPLEQEDQVTRSKDPYLYAPRPGFRLGRSGRADFTVHVAEPSREPLRLEVLDAGGAVIRTLEAKPRAGLNRVTWDLRYEAPKPVELRTVAPDNPFIWREPRFRGKQTRPIVHWGIERTVRAGPLAAPGAYAVRLAGAPDSRRTFMVVKDPEIPSSDEDLGQSTLAQRRIRDAMNATAEMVNRIEVMRKQIEDLRSERGGEPAMEQALQELGRKMLDVELMMLSRHDLHSDDKWYVEQYKLYMNLIWLSGVIGTGAGDVAGGADERPTEAAMSVLTGLEQELEAARAAFRRLVDTEVPAFNEAMKGKGLPSIGASPATTSPP
jgi:photosystem II stability/assembly factor-like uncharacterized protein